MLDAQHKGFCEYSCRYPCLQWPKLQQHLQKCRYDVAVGRRPSADDLLVLLAVGRSGRYNTAAEELGLNHTTISRRIAALEQSIGGRVLARSRGGWELTDLGREALSAAEAVESAVRSLTVDPAARTLEGVVRISATDGFSAYIAAPAAAQVQRRHPKVAVEIVAATRRATQQRSGLDIEVVVGEPQVHRAEAIRLGDYCLGLYGSREYLAEHGTPPSIAIWPRHPLVYFIDSMLQVDDLDLARVSRPPCRQPWSTIHPRETTPARPTSHLTPHRPTTTTLLRGHVIVCSQHLLRLAPASSTQNIQYLTKNSSSTTQHLGAAQ